MSSIGVGDVPENNLGKRAPQEVIAALRRDFVAKALRVAAIKASHAADDILLGDDHGAEREIRLAISHLRSGAAAYGAIRCVIAALEIRTVLLAPTVWKKYFRLGSDKEKSRALALRTFAKTPEHFSRKRDHGRAEAALLALYAFQTIHATPPLETACPRHLGREWF